MKNLVIGLLISTFLLSACGGTPPLTQPTPVSSIDNSTSTPSPLPTATRTLLPSSTPTASVTPLPTIPTFTPTFDVSTIVTVTPAPKAECPAIDQTVKPNDYLPSKIEIGFFNIVDNVLDYLNKGGDGQLLLEQLDKISPETEFMGGYDFRDLDGDQEAEFLYIEFQTAGKPLVFSCQSGKFESLAILSGDYDHLAYTMKIDDLNMNGIPELIIIGTSGASYPASTIYLYEWDGLTFSILGQVTIQAMRQIQIYDLGGNGTKEISFSGDNPVCTSCSNLIPQRQRTITYGWNGRGFVEILNEFEPPKYRFQALQDADAAIVVGKPDKALQLYEETISNEQLNWWSSERLTYEQHIANPVYMFIATPSTVPTEDPTEYPRLGAYAYYRIMLLHLVQGYESDATVVYTTLQQKFGDDPYGRPYVEMAAAFWEAYQSTKRMYDGCAAAIQYAVEHPEILIPLGSDYHGAQSNTYVPADVCPFR